VGLAQYLYDQVKDVQWSGVLTLVEEEVSGLVGIGQAVNVIGGRPEWAAMRAMVQSVTEEIETGTTRIELGPPEHLGIQDLVELLKVGRRRSRWTNPAVMAGEDLDEIALGKATANTDSGMGPTQQSYLSLTPDKETVAGKYSHINLDAKGSALQMAAKDKPGKFAVAMAPAGTNKPQLILAGDEDGAAVAVGKLQVDFADILAAVPAGDARTIKLREVCVKVNGQEKKMLVLGGGPY